MSEYLPDVYIVFREAYPEVAQALDDLGATAGDRAPGRTVAAAHQLGIVVGGLAEGRSGRTLAKPLS